MAGNSKVLIIGGTGYIGKHIVNASVKLGHPTFALVRTTTPTDPAKIDLLQSFQEAGVTLLVGDLTDHKSLVAALKQVDVVIATIKGSQLAEQTRILDAAKEAGTIKRFLPSEFGMDYDRVEHDIPVTTNAAFKPKVAIRRAVENSGIPYTIVVSYAFAGLFLAPLLQNSSAPPRDGKLIIYGDGNAKATFNDEVDIGVFTIQTIDDPRTVNKKLHIRPKDNIASQNEVTDLWEKKIGRTFEKEYVDKASLLKSVQESAFPTNLKLAFDYSMFVKGDTTSYSLDPSIDLEASELYPDVKYTNVDEYLTGLV